MKMPMIAITNRSSEREKPASGRRVRIGLKFGIPFVMAGSFEARSISKNSKAGATPCQSRDGKAISRETGLFRRKRAGRGEGHSAASPAARYKRWQPPTGFSQADTLDRPGSREGSGR